MKKVKGGIEIKLYDKISAIDRLSKMLGWDGPTRVDLNGSVNTSFLEQMSNEELEKFIRGEIDRQGFNETPKE
jgi:hypothetical protein